MNEDEMKELAAQLAPSAADRAALDAALSAGTYEIILTRLPDSSLVDCIVRKPIDERVFADLRVRAPRAAWSTQFTTDSIEPQIRAVWQELTARIASSVKRPGGAR